jgi:hypothetical protein
MMSTAITYAQQSATILHPDTEETVTQYNNWHRTPTLRKERHSKQDLENK